MVVLIEPWVSGTRANKIIRKLGFQYSIREEAVGFSRGIWILWSNPTLNILLIYKCRQLIHVSIFYNNTLCYFTALYGSHVPLIRSELWNICTRLNPKLTALGFLQVTSMTC